VAITDTYFGLAVATSCGRTKERQRGRVTERERELHNRVKSSR